MTMNRPLALLVGLLTLLPWAFFVYFFATVMWQFPVLPAADAPPEQFFQDFQSIFRLQMVAMALVLGLVAFYVIHLFSTSRVPSEKKALWAVVLFLGNLFAMPFYWYFYIWPPRGEGAA